MKNNIFYNIPLLVVLSIAGYLYTGASWVGGFLGLTTGIIALYDNNRRKILRDKDEKIKLLNDCVNLLLVTDDFEKREKITKELNINTSLSLHYFYNYYRNEYLEDLEIFIKACPSHKITYNQNNNLIFVNDFKYLEKSGSRLLKKKYFMYFMAIQTALLMTVHSYYSNEKYEEFKNKNKGLLFEFGTTNTFSSPWGILQMLNIPFDKELFSSCLGLAIDRLMTDDYFCGLIPNDFIDKFIDDPDLNKKDTIYGKEWRSICLEEWFNQTSCIYPKNPMIL